MNPMFLFLHLSKSIMQILQIDSNIVTYYLRKIKVEIVKLSKIKMLKELEQTRTEKDQFWLFPVQFSFLFVHGTNSFVSKFRMSNVLILKKFGLHHLMPTPN